MPEPEPKDVLEAGFKALFGPVHELFLKLTGPAAEEYGLMWGDEVKMRRAKRLVKGLAKTKRMLAEAGLDPQAVPDKLLLPIFEGMSGEDDEDLHTMWAALLANAASPWRENAKPGFIVILRQMSPDEAGLLNWMETDTKVRYGPMADVITPFEEKTLIQAYTDLGLAGSDYHIQLASETMGPIESCLDGLRAAGLIDKAQGTYALTWRAKEFLYACRPPKPKS